MDEETRFEGFVTITIPNVLVSYLGGRNDEASVYYAVDSLLNGDVDPIRATFEIKDDGHKALRTVTGEVVLKIDGPYEHATFLEQS